MSEYFNVVDPRDVEPYFSRHMLAMSVENLYAKGDIAMELAVRDAEIERLQGLLTVALTASDQITHQVRRIREALGHEY